MHTNGQATAPRAFRFVHITSPVTDLEFWIAVEVEADALLLQWALA